MAVKIVKKKNKKKDKQLAEGKGQTTITHPNGGEEVEQFNALKPQVFDEPPANVIVKLGYTKNLGNYESMRVDVSLSMPCEPKDIDEQFDYCREWVDDKMSGIVEGIEAETED